MYSILPVYKPYAWGSYSQLQTMFGGNTPSTEKRPLAEVWFSGHHQWPSMISSHGDAWSALTENIRNNPEFMLGSQVSEEYGPELPFLLKVISARIPLSLQVHPVSFQARAGYNLQEAAGIAMDAAERSFKDTVAKSEMIVALEPFEASVGFLPVSRMLRNLEMVDHTIARRMVNALTVAAPAKRSTSGEYAEYDRLMPISASVWSETSRQIFRAFAIAIDQRTSDTGDAEQADNTLEQAVVEASNRVVDSQDILAFRYALLALQAFPGDVSALTLLMMNPVSLDQGEAVFIPAGTPHVYMHGTAVEIMTNSDNVLRAGMTEKYKDIPNLLNSLDCRASAPVDPANVGISGSGVSEIITYKPDLREFMLSYGRVNPLHIRWNLAQRLALRYPGLIRPLSARSYRANQHGPRIVLCTDGEIRCATRSDMRILSRGDAVFVPSGEGPVDIEAVRNLRIMDNQDTGTFVIASTQI